MNIRTIVREDLPRCTDLFIRAFAGEPWKEHWTEESAGKRLRQFFETTSFHGLLLEEEGEPIAMILGQREEYYDGPRFFIQEFFCIRQGGGYGSKLLAELEGQMAAEGVVRIYLMTIHGPATEGYYQNRGYVTDPEAIWMYKLTGGN